MRRPGLLSLILPLAACSADAAAPPAPTTVRGALADGVELAISPAESTGAVVARLFRTGWEDDAVALTITGGAFSAVTDARGDLRLDDLALDLAPIALPDDVLGGPAALTGLHVTFAAEVPPATLAWVDDTATAHAALSLRLAWTLHQADHDTPLGPITLTGLPVDLELGGTPDRLAASVGLVADGTLWSWAHLIELADLSLTLVGSTAAAE